MDNNRLSMKKEQESVEERKQGNDLTPEEIEALQEHVNNVIELSKTAQVDIHELMIPWDKIPDEPREEAFELQHSFWLAAAYTTFSTFVRIYSENSSSGKIGMALAGAMNLLKEHKFISLILILPMITMLILGQVGILITYFLIVLLLYMVIGGLVIKKGVKEVTPLICDGDVERPATLSELEELKSRTEKELRYCEDRGGLPEGSWEDFKRIMERLQSGRYTSLTTAMESLGYEFEDPE